MSVFYMIAMQMHWFYVVWHILWIVLYVFYFMHCIICTIFCFFLRTFIVPFYTIILGYYRDTVSRCHPRLLHLVQLPLHLGFWWTWLGPTRAPGLVHPLLGRVDPAVIEDIRLVNAELIRLGGPKRQKGVCWRENQGSPDSPRKNVVSPVRTIYRKI